MLILTGAYGAAFSRAESEITKSVRKMTKRWVCAVAACILLAVALPVAGWICYAAGAKDGIQECRNALDIGKHQWPGSRITQNVFGNGASFLREREKPADNACPGECWMRAVIPTRWEPVYMSVSRNDGDVTTVSWTMRDGKARHIAAVGIRPAPETERSLAESVVRAHTMQPDDLGWAFVKESDIPQAILEDAKPLGVKNDAELSGKNVRKNGL